MSDLTPHMEARLAGIERQMASQAAATEKIADSLESLVRLEEKHNGMAERIADHARLIEKLSDKLALIDTAMPGLKRLEKWVLGGVMTGAGMIALATFKMVFGISVP